MKKKIMILLLFLLSITSIINYSTLNTNEEKEEEKEPIKKNQLVAFTVEGENVDMSFPQKESISSIYS